MQYTRIGTNARGDSHFDKATLDLKEADYRPPAPNMFVSHAFEADGLQFIRLPAGWAGAAIRPPKRQFLICLKGELEVTSSDGKTMTFKPGDAVLMDDTEGKGHSTRAGAAGECIAAIIPVD